MVDFDLAMLYGVQNKRLNEQVKRNIERVTDGRFSRYNKSPSSTFMSVSITLQSLSVVKIEDKCQ